MREIQQKTSRVSSTQQQQASGVPFIQKQSKQQTTAQATGMTRTTFDQEVNTRFGITTVRNGTMQDQVLSVQRYSRGATLPTTIPGWQSWDPGSQSPKYDAILAGIQDLANAFGGIPPVQSISFFHSAYDYSNGNYIQQPNTGADYSAGILNVYHQFDSISSFPVARSTTATTAGGRPGAPIPALNPHQSGRQTISHELGHGIAEAAHLANPNVFQDFNLAAGWHNGHLYDAGNTQVQSDLSQGNTPGAQFEITAANWNNPRWIDQPMSRYAVSGGQSEDFAESIAAFAQVPSVLQARAPRRYAFIQSNIASWRAHLRSVTAQAGGGASGNPVRTRSPQPPRRD
ncbi:MAG: hypothetical protein IT269_00255 [Saprospiraceae bacterium]|nr:hypothetical protein [Saprospiraceae bacterium]